MNLLSGIIRRDKEFTDLLGVMREALVSPDTPAPIVVNGLSGGAETLFLAEAVTEAKRMSGAPVLLLVRSESEAQSVTEALSGFGLTII